jgi:hypothetical protein
VNADDLQDLAPFDSTKDVEQSGTTNGERSDRGYRLIDLYAQIMEFNRADRNENYAVGDAICDMLHAAHRHGHDVDEVIASAIEHFRAETGKGSK